MTDPQYPELDFRTFLESTPPYTWIHCTNFHINHVNGAIYFNSKIKISLNCDSEYCKGDRLFSINEVGKNIWLDNSNQKQTFLTYNCCNCKGSPKIFALSYQVEGSLTLLQKLGQTPMFGKKLPNQVNKLIKGERELFLKGMICENQGMGIGAFGYYRRVLDSQKNRIFDEIIKVVNLTATDKSIIVELEAAKAETQFTKAVDSIKHAFPEGLLISGYNPLKLLYKAVSEGLHNHSDEVCLEMAQSIKLVLFEFTKRLSDALSDNKELTGAIGHLMKIKQKKS